MKTTFSIAAFVFSVLAVGAAAGPLDRGTSSAMDKLVEDHMVRGNVPGAAIAVLRRGEVLKVGSYGLANVELNVPVTQDSVFDLASVTKPVTAAAILVLAEEGKLSLDDPITRYIDDPPAAWDGITVRQLLSHMGGLAHHFEEKVNGSHLLNYSKADMLRSAKALPLLSKPGTDWEYSDQGYFLLGVILERVTGKSYEAFLRKRFFEPLGMTTMRLLDEGEIIPGRVAGYTVIDGRLQNNRRDWQFELTSHMGLMSNIQDMIRWEQGLVAGRVVPQSVKDKMWAVERAYYETEPGSPVGYGFGWWVENKGETLVVEHSGHTGTHFLRNVTSGLSVMILTNRDIPAGVPPYELARGLARIAEPSENLGWLIPFEPN